MVKFKIKFASLMSHLISSIRNVSVFKRLIVAFLTLITLPTLAITSITYNTYTKEVENNISVLLSYTAHNVTQSITKQMQSYENLIYNLYLDESLMDLVFKSLNPALDETERADITAKINNHLYLYTAYYDPNIFNLQIVTPKDQFTQINLAGEKKGGYIKKLEQFIDSPYYIGAKSFKGHPIWFDTTFESDLFYRQHERVRPIVDSLTLIQSIPNYYLQDSIGAIVLNVYMNGIVKNINSSLLDKSGHLVLIGPNGTLASINAKLQGPIPTDTPSLLDEIGDDLEGVFFTEMEDRTCIVAFEKLANSNFYVLNLAYYDNLIKNARDIRNLTLLTMCVVMLVAIIIAYIVTLSITRPLDRLKRLLDKLPTQGFQGTFTDSSDDEIGILGTHFNTMVQEIQNLIHQVYLSEIHAKQLAFKKKEAELNALQMQINPHFLYNTLDIIRWEIIALEDGNGKVSQMVESFSSFLRLSIPKHSELVPIIEEVRHIESYLQVINYRYPSKVSFHSTLDTVALNACIPKLTFQPLIENCILHAFKGNTAHKTITLSAYTKQELLVLVLSDNGKGMSTTQQQVLNAHFSNPEHTGHTSIGLYNVCERLQLYFGTAYGLCIVPADGIGTTVEIRIPLYYTLSRLEDSHV
ncbi:MAG: cache domain-containing sensor histidine kinase [Cellulosilyticaceae bacterium]